MNKKTANLYEAPSKPRWPNCLRVGGIVVGGGPIVLPGLGTKGVF